MSRTKAAILAVLCLVGTYVFADVWDIVPGVLTLQDPENKAADYPNVRKGKNYLDTVGGVQEADAPLPSAQHIQQVLNSLQKDSRIKGKVSAIVIDGPTQRVLGQLDVKRPATPASTIKLLTAGAALENLGPEKRFSTVAKLQGTKVFLVGGGDILLAADKGNPDAVVGHAGLGDLARSAAKKLKAQKITRVQVAVDESLFQAPEYVAGLEAEKQQWVMESSPLAINRNFRNPPYTESQPGQKALEKFAQHLVAAGIEVKIVGKATAPKDAEKIAQVDSASLREIVEICLRESDNSLAETLGHLLAISEKEKADFAGASRAVQSILRAQDYDLTGVRILDSSGLSSHNKITVHLLGQFLQTVWNCDKCRLASLPAALPVASLNGTLHDRFLSTDMAGEVRAKTGSLEDVGSLAGFMYTKAGRPLIFAIIIDNLEPGTLFSARVVMDEALANIAR